MSGARWTALVVVAALALGAVGCGSGESDTDVEKITLVTPGTDNDPDWSLQAKSVVTEFPRQLGVRAAIADASQADGDVREVLEQVSGEGTQLVIAHDARYADDAAAVAQETGVPALVWGEPRDDAGGKVAGLTVQAKESGYLAGLTSAKASFRRRLGIVIADDGTDWDLQTWNEMAGGFIAGARSIDRDTLIWYQQAGRDGNATEADAYRATRRMIAGDIQMILGLGGKASVGVLRAIEDYRSENETLFVGAVTDRSSTRKYEEGGVPFMLGSLIWELRGAYKQAIRDLRDGTYGEHPYPLTLRNRGIWLFQSGRMPADAYEAALEAEAQISAGRIQVPSTPTSLSIEQLIVNDGSGPEG